MTPGESPLYALLNEINSAAAEGLPLLAIAMTVALPDICSSLISDDGRTNGEKYKEWCAANLDHGDFFGFITPDDLWSMRCGVLHNGRFDNLKHNVPRVIFVMPGNTTIENCRINGAYVYNVVEFCSNFTNCVYNWFEANRENEILKKNTPNLMQYRDNGLYPLREGVTVLA